MTKRQESALILKLQKELGWMFYDVKESERYTFHFQRNRKTGKTSLTPARRMYLIVHSKSWLAQQMEANLVKPRTKRKKAK